MGKITEKGPGDFANEIGKPKTLKKMPDGNSYPYEREYNVENGVQDDTKADKGLGEPDYTPKAEKQLGDDGQG